MRHLIISVALAASALTIPAWVAAAGHGGGGMHGGAGMGSHGMGAHGSLVSQTAHTAQASGMKVGPQVRTVARSKSQGPKHANQHAIDAVNGTHGKAGSNSVLGTNTSASSNAISGKARKHK